MKKTFLLLIFLFAFLPLTQASQAFDTTCHAWVGSSDEQATYCVTTPPQMHPKKRYPILYFLHGGGGSARSWQRSGFGKNARAYAIGKNYKHPIVVSISLGSMWLLTDTGHLEFFVKEFMPFVEKHLPFNGIRGVWGLSMGGLNGFQLYFKYPKKFDSFTLACPAVTTISPFSTRVEIKAYMNRTKAHGPLIYQMNHIFADYFPTQADWDKHDVLALARKLPRNKAMPALAFSCGKKDEYGFQEGSQHLSMILRSKRIFAEFELLDGQHCTMKEETFVDFHQTHLFPDKPFLRVPR